MLNTVYLRFQKWSFPPEVIVFSNASCWSHRMVCLESLLSYVEKDEASLCALAREHIFEKQESIFNIIGPRMFVSLLSWHLCFFVLFSSVAETVSPNWYLSNVLLNAALLVPGHWLHWLRLMGTAVRNIWRELTQKSFPGILEGGLVESITLTCKPRQSCSPTLCMSTWWQDSV